MTIKEFLSMFHDISEAEVFITRGAHPSSCDDIICVAGGSVQFIDGEFISVENEVYSDEVYSTEEILAEAPDEYGWMMNNNRDVWTRQMVVSRLNSVLLGMEVEAESVRYDRYHFKIGVSTEDFQKLYGAIGKMYFD